MTEPQYLRDAADRLAKARTIRDQYKERFAIVSDDLDSADAALRKAQSRYLGNPEDAELVKAMDAAREVHASLSKEQADSERWLLSADDLYQEATAAHDLAVRQYASERIRANSEKLLSMAQKADEHFAGLVDAIIEGDKINRLITHDARTDLKAPTAPVAKWREQVMAHITQCLSRVRNGEAAKFISAHVAAEQLTSHVDDLLVHPPAESAN